MVTYEVMTPQCGRSVVQVLVVKSGYRSGDLRICHEEKINCNKCKNVKIYSANQYQNNPK